MSALVRTRIGPYRIEDAVLPDELTAETIDRFLLSPSTAVEALPKYVASEAEIGEIRAGRPFGSALGDGPNIEPPSGSIAVVSGKGDLLCLAEFDNGKSRLLPRRVFVG